MAAVPEAAPQRRPTLASIMYAEATGANPAVNTTGWKKKDTDVTSSPYHDGKVYWDDMPHVNRVPVDLNAIWEKTADNRVRRMSKTEVEELLSGIVFPKTLRLVMHKDKDKFEFAWQTFQSSQWITYARDATKGLKMCLLRATSDFSLVELKLLHADGRCLGWNRGHQHVENDLHYVVKEPSGQYSFTSGTPSSGPNFENVWNPQMVERLLQSNPTSVSLQPMVTNFRARWNVNYDALTVSAALHTNGDKVHLTIDLKDKQSQYHFYVTKPKEGSRAYSRAVGGWILIGILCPSIDKQEKRTGGYGPPLPPLKKKPVAQIRAPRGNETGTEAAPAQEAQTDASAVADDDVDIITYPDIATAEAALYAAVEQEKVQEDERDAAAA